MNVIYLILAVGLIILGINRFKIHPFLCLFAVAIVYALAIKMPINLIVDAINEGFGKTLGILAW